MKINTRHNHSLVAVGLCAFALMCAVSTRAANITKAGSGTDLTDGASWTGSAAPTANDVAVWDTGSLGSGLTLNSGAPSWLGIQVNAGAANPISISSGGALTLGTSGINMSNSAINATIACDVTLASGYQSWSVASGKSLSINGALSRSAGASMSFPTTNVASTTLANDSTGILGGWATLTGTSDWAAMSGTNVTTYLGYSSVGGSTTGAGGTTQNWKNTSATTLTTTATVNSLNQQFDFTVNSGVTLTLGSGGLILGSTERWLLGTGGTIKSGLATGELYIHANTAAFNNGFQIQPVIVDGLAATAVIKDGSGQCEMGNGNNTFSGGFYLNAGAVYLGASSTGSGGAPTKGPLGTGTVTINSGTLFPYGKNNGTTTTAGYTLANNIYIPAGASAAINNGGGTGILSGNISGIAPGFLGAGLTALQGVNSYIGGTMISVGTLAIGNAAGVNNNLSTGTITVTNGGTLRLGYAVTSNQNKSYTPNDITLAGGYIYADDAFQHLTGNVNVTAASTNGSTYNAGNNGAAESDKGLYYDGIVSGLAPLTVQHSRIGTGNTYNTSFVAFTNNANTYSGTITVNENTTSSEGGVYLGVNGNTALQYATIVISPILGSNLKFGTSPIVFKSGLGSATLGAVNGSGPLVLAGYDEVNHTYTGGGNIALTLGGNNASTTDSGVISGGGSLIKVGSGTFTLSATNTYTGSTTISAGTLTIGGAGQLGSGIYSGAIINNSFLTYSSSAAQALLGAISGSGNLTNAGTGALTLGGSLSSSQNNLIVSDGAILNESYLPAAQLTLTSLTVGTNTGATLGFVANSTSLARYASGTLTLKGTATINILGGNFTAGSSYPLIAYTTLTGGGSYVLGTMPYGVGGNLSTSGNTIYFNVTGVTNTLWTGLVNGTWDINTTANWTNPGTLGNKYIDGAVIQFDDTGINTTTISNSVATTLTPGSVLVTNNTKNYAFTANTIIAGNGTLTKTGTANMTNATASTYTGPTIINQGQIVAGVASVANVSGAVGNNSALTLANDSTAALNLNNFSTQIGALSGGGSAGGNVTLGSATLTAGADNSTTTYAGAISGTGGLTKVGTGTLTLSGTNTAAGSYSVNNGAIVVTGNGSINATTNPAGRLLIGTVSGFGGALYQNGANSLVCIGNSGGFGQLGSVAAASGYYNLSAGTLVITNGGELDPGGSGGGAGTFGQFDMSGGAVYVGQTNGTGSTYFLPNRGASGECSVVNFNGGTFLINSNMVENATFAGYEVNWAAGNQTNATTISGSAAFLSPSVSVKLNQNNNSGNVCSLNLNGGTFQTLGFTAGHCASSTVNFNGGTLKAGSSANASFMGNVGQATVYSGGAVVDDNGTSMGINLTLQPPAGSGISSIPVATGGAGYITPPQVIISDVSGSGATAYATISGGAVTAIVVTCPGNNYSSPTATLVGGGYTTAATVGSLATAANVSGGLTKIGSGTLTMSASMSYTGPTRVLAGTLNLTPSTGLYMNSDVIVSGATLRLDLTTSGTFNAASLRLTNAVISLAYGTVGSNPSSAAISASGSLSKGGNTTFNVSGLGLGVGVIPLITLPGLNNTNGFVLGTLPTGVNAVLTNSAPGELDLFITSAGQLLTWKGSSADNSFIMTNWNINTDTNWIDQLNPGNQTKYQQYSANTIGDNVVFGNYGYTAADGTNYVVLSTSNVVPATVLFSAGTPYMLTGSKGIGGVTSVQITNDTSYVFLATSNYYTGGTSVATNGTLIITNNNALGAVSGGVTMYGGALQLNGPVASSRAVALNNNSAIRVAANNTATLSGVISGIGGLTQNDNGVLALAGNNTYSGTTVINGAGKLTVNGGTLGTNTADIQIATTSTDASSLEVAGGTVNANRVIIAGDSANTGNAGNGTVTQTGGTIISRQWFTVGSGGTTVAGGATGTYNFGGGTLIIQSQQMEVGNFTNTTGTVNMSNSAVLNILNNSFLTLGANNEAAAGTFNQYGGTVTLYSDGGTNIGGNGVLYIGRAGVSTGTFTYNLNGGTAIVPQVLGNAANAAARVFNFNSGTLRASKSNTSFMSGLSAANVLSGGAIVDSSSNTITISQALLDGGGGGGLVKQGSGTLTLTGTNNYTGLTTVANGELVLTPAYQAGGAVTVANGATFGISASSVSNSAAIGALTMGSGGASTLDFTYGFAGNPTNVALTAGAVTLSGTSSIHVGGSFSLGAFPVLKYASLSGSFNSTVSAPRGMGASVSNDATHSTIYVVVTSLANPIVWTGTNSIAGKTNLWDLNSTTNWLITGSPTTYQETLPPGDAVLFNDSGSGTVLLSNTASPAAVTFNNNSVNYTIQGSGQINALSGLTKNGSGSVTLGLPGTYSISTVVSNGTLSIGANQTFANFSGNSTVATASGTPTLTVANTSNTVFSGSIQGALALTKTNAGTLTLTGTNTFTGNVFGKGGTILIDSGAIYGGAAYSSIGQDGADIATLTLKGTGTFTNNNDFNVGDIGSATGTLNISNSAVLTVGNMYVASANAGGSTASGTVNQTSGSVSNTSLIIGGRQLGGTNAVGVYNLSGGTLTSSGAVQVGGFGTGALNVSGSAVASFASTGLDYVGYRTGTGTLAMTGGSFNAAGELRVGGSDVNGSANIARGTVTLANATMLLGALNVARGNYLDNAVSGSVTLNSGSTLICTNDTTLQFAGTGLGKLVINGGTFIIGPAATKWLMVGGFDAGAGELDITNGNLLLENGTSIKMCRNGNTGGNVVNQAGGNVTFYSDAGTTVGGGGALDLDYAGGASSASTYNLNGGTLTVPQIIKTAANGTGTINLNGGTLKAATSSTTFMQGLTAANVAPGAIIDTAGNNITIAQALLDNGGGSLTKTGNGTLTLNGANTYTGSTTVNAGALAGTGTIAGALNNNATLAAGSGATGTLTVTGNITLAAGSTNTFAVNGTTLANTAVAAGAAVTYGGVLQIVPGGTFTVGQKFHLFSGAGATNNASNFSSVQSTSPSVSFTFTNGWLTVAASGPSGPATLTNSVSGTTLHLTWPAGQSWRLVSQTNSLATGLNTNSAAWFTVPGYTDGSYSVGFNPANPTVFYKLVYP